MQRIPHIVLAFGAVLLGLAAGAQPYTTDPSRLPLPIVDGDVPILEPRGMALYDPMDLDHPLEPEITIENVTDLGYDVRYVFKNTSGSPRPIGRLDIGILALGERIRMYDHGNISTWRDFEHGTFSGVGWPYPGNAYSPVMVVMNQTHAVGISLMYPVMEYKHDALIRLSRVGGIFRGPPEKLGWMVTFDLSDAPGVTQYTRLSYQAVVQPGETRAYTVAIRAMARPDLSGSVTSPQEWLTLLDPYRAYFQSRYGSVQYDRRTKPVLAREVANNGAIEATNRRGLGGGVNRPDRVGFAPMANAIVRENLGYDSVMLWAPSGMFYNNQELNYPSRFTAGWLDLPKLRTATDSIGLPSIPRSGKELGLWWGHSARHMDRWDDNESEPLDPSNPVHMELVHTQLDLAEQAGATLIGLDAFTHAHMPVWAQVPYLQHLKQRYPEMSFITEQVSSDLVHVVTPTFNRAFQAEAGMSDEEDFHRLDRPAYLADYLLPGHEIWGYFRYSDIVRRSSSVIDASRLQRDAERIARNGYVPVISSSLPLISPSLTFADATWLTTVPGHSGNQDSTGDGGGGSEDGQDTNGTGDSDATIPPPDGKAEEPRSKPDNPTPPRVYYITLPDGRRLKIRTTGS